MEEGEINQEGILKPEHMECRCFREGGSRTEQASARDGMQWSLLVGNQERVWVI